MSAIETIEEEIARVEGEQEKSFADTELGALCVRARMGGRVAGLKFALHAVKNEIEKLDICPECSRPVWSSTVSPDGVVSFAVDKCKC